MIKLIPEPKKIKYNTGKLDLKKVKYIFSPASMGKHAGKLAYLIKNNTKSSMEIVLLSEDINSIYISKDKISQKLSINYELDKKESYCMLIKNDAIIIDGGDSAGLFYGIQTLIQLIEDDVNISCCEIKDWPDMVLRGVHFDLKGCMPSFDYLKMAVERLAHYKINTILMEYEDKIRLGSHPVLAVSSAISKENAEELAGIAKENHIEIIPLVQTLGHAEYILRHEEYAHLRETSDFYQQMCPSNPHTFRFVTEIIDEMMEIHKDAKYFHIGGDETRQLGECPLCKEKAENGGKYNLYFDYVKKVCEYVVSKGKIPIIWDDIMARYLPEFIEKLPKSTILLYWLYRNTSDTSSSFTASHGFLLSESWTHKQYDSSKAIPTLGKYIFDEKHKKVIIEDLPQDIYDTYKKYSQTENFPVEIDSTILIKLIKEKGLRVIGGAGASISSDGNLPDYERALPNIRMWARSIAKNEELGAVSTAWTRSGGMHPVVNIMEGFWYPFIASAEYYWTSGGVSEKEFDMKFCKRFYGLGGLEATDAIWLIKRQSLTPSDKDLDILFIELAVKAKRNSVNLKYYSLVSRLIKLQELGNVISGYAGQLLYVEKYHKAQGRWIARYNAEVEEFENLLVGTRNDIMDSFGFCLHPDDVEDFIKSVFDWQEFLLVFYKSIIKA